MKDPEYVAGIKAAAGIAADYNSSSDHPYRLDDCILAKLNVSRRRPRLNPKSPFLQGYATALASLIRLYDKPSLVKSVMTMDGITLKKLIDAGAEEFDLKQLRKVKR